MTTNRHFIPGVAVHQPRPHQATRRYMAIVACLSLLAITVPMTAVGATSARRDAARVIYVSPSGNDKSTGTQARPIKTLSRARDLIRSIDRKMSGNLTVFLEPGTYRLSQTLQFNASDSGTNGHTVIWTGGSAGATISGAQRITGWSVSNHGLNIWAAHVSSAENTRQIYVNGMRATVASGPAPARLTKTATGYTASSSAMAQWRNPNQIDFVYTAQLGLMVEPRCPVASISGRTITMAEPCWQNSNGRTHNLVGFGTLKTPDYIENAYELLRKPGQFYLDRQKHILYYMPRSGQNMRTADVEAPVVQSLINGRGSASAPIHNIDFVNLTFEYGTWLQPSSPTGFSDMQSGFTITGANGSSTQGLCQTVPHGTCPYGDWTKEPGNVQFAYDHDLSFGNDRFVHLGGAGLNLDDGSQSDSVSRSVFTDISGNGVEVGNVDLPQATGSNQTQHVTIKDNHIFGIGDEYHGGVAIQVGYAANTTITHNTVDHVPYSGISMGWGGWPDKKDMPATANFSHGNVVSDNVVSDFMQTLSDGGGIYTQGITGSSMSSGEKVTGNVIHDQLAWGRAMQSDDGATFVTYAGNALYNDNYDWGSNHLDYAAGGANDDPQLIKGNYWQQGDPNSSIKNVVISNNTIIAGAAQVPNSLLANAGIQPQYRSLLSWRPAGETVPNAPERVAALYAYGGKAYVTWRPSYEEGDTSVSSYTVSACRATRGIAQQNCGGSAKIATISESAYQRLGYAIVNGLSTGSQYAITITAHSSGGASTPSVPSPVVSVASQGPTKSGACQGLLPRPGSKLVRLAWYAPTSSAKQPITAYTVTPSGGGKQTITGLRQLIVSNNGGRVIDIVTGLRPGKSYKFTVAAVTPAGAGPSVTSSSVKAGG